MTATQRVAQGLMVIFGLLTIVFYSSVYAATGKDAFPDDANALIATAGVSLGVLVIALATVGINSSERWAWLDCGRCPRSFSPTQSCWAPGFPMASSQRSALWRSS